MEKVWLGLGSNLGNSQQILQEAWKTLGNDPNVFLIVLSSPYISDPVGMESDNRFVNAVGIFETRLDPLSLLDLLQLVEKGFGRKTKTDSAGYQDRLLDLDVLYFGNTQSSARLLQLPHPQIANRLFVLTPLAEIDPLHTDPCTQKTATEMHSELMLKNENGETVLQEIKRSSWELKE
jgi:2-amino-4-hydroxy-6-hydroxymethyldihydropteridine diphosphokinase